VPEQNDSSDEDDGILQCYVCEWYNPPGSAQCERCTAFLHIL
jgi:hypothetical protein